MQRLAEYKVRQGDTISVKNRRNKGKMDKVRIGKAARTPRALAHLDTLKTRCKITVNLREPHKAKENMKYLLHGKLVAPSSAWKQEGTWISYPA
jgi:hypothetical protein